MKVKKKWSSGANKTEGKENFSSASCCRCHQEKSLMRILITEAPLVGQTLAFFVSRSKLQAPFAHPD